MSVNITTFPFDRGMGWPGQISTPGSTAVVPARRTITQNPNPDYPRFPSVPTYGGWRIDYQTYNLRRSEDNGISEIAAEGIESAASLHWCLPGSYGGTASTYGIAVHDADIGTAVPGEGLTIGISFPSDALCGAYSGAYSDQPIGIVQCINPTINVVAWTAAYFLLDNVLLRSGMWTACQTDLPFSAAPNVLIQIAAGGADIESNYHALTGVRRFNLLVSRSQPVPAIALWGAGRDYFHDHFPGDLDNLTTPFPGDPNYKSVCCYMERVEGAIVTGVPGYDPSRPVYLLVLNPEGIARRTTAYDVPYYIYSSSYFEPVSLSFLGITLTNEPMGLLPPNVQVVNLHIPPITGGGTHSNTVPGASPALLGHPSRHYNRAVAALNAGGTATTGILFWRSSRAIPLMTNDSLLASAPLGGIVWDTPGAGISITAQSGDESPSLAEDARGLLYCLFHRPSQGAMLSRSDDDGDTWGTPVLAISGGAHPAMASCEGRTLCAAVTTTGTAPNLVRHITAVYRGPGDPLFGTPYTFRFSAAGGTLTPLSVADDCFSIVFTDENAGRMGMHVLLSGEGLTSDWWSADNGETWTRIPIS